MTNSIFKVLIPGINTTYQDEGRFGLQHLGVPTGGCMDHQSFLLANELVGNKKKYGVIEFAYQGPLLKLIKGKTKIAITGNIFFKIINLNNETINGECNRSYDLNEGDSIDILATNKSTYGYMSVEGGFKIESFCNSVSTLSKAGIGANNGNKISLENKIITNTNRKRENNFRASILLDNSNTIRVLKGPQYNFFSEKSKILFFSQSYKVSNLTDRMGMRLMGEALENLKNTNIRSEGITKGAIQVPADGQPIILLTDCPTIGGYPKIANIITADYDLLIQKTPGTNIFFKCIDIKEAELLYKKKCDNISKIIKNIRKIN